MKQLTTPNREEIEQFKKIGKDRTTKFLLNFQCILAVTGVFIFFTFFDVYEWENFHIIPPVLFINLFSAIVIAMLFIARRSRISYTVPAELILWCAGYLAISLLGFLLIISLPSNPGEAGEQQLRTRILSEFFIVVMFLIFSKHTKVQTLTRFAICLAVIISIVNNVLEFVDPSIFGVLNTTGRAAGFYMNPNITGCALILGMIFGLGVLPQKLRIPYAIIVLIGVFMTFSRGAILGWFVVMGFFYKSNSVPRKQLLIWVGSTIGISLLFGSILSGLFDLDELQRSGVVTANFDNIRERLEWFQNPKSEDSADSRLEVVAIAWKMFSERPLLGNGLASTDNLNNWGISTHNMYLLHIADHGIFGVLILPSLVYAVTRNSQGESRDIAWTFGTFILMWGFFSHNILEERYILMCFSLMAAMNRSSRQKRKRKSLQDGDRI
jgi:O-antigen ligase